MREIKFRAIIPTNDDSGNVDWFIREHFRIESEFRGKKYIESETPKYFEVYFNLFDLFGEKDGTIPGRHLSCTLTAKRVVKEWLLSGGNLDQFTGLKDRKDKEIYDGDIVKFQYIGLSYKIGQVGFIENSLCIGIKVYNEVNDFYKCVYSLYNIIEDKVKKIEVIGNIYENIDLLAGGHHEKF
jgi:uncharacterized phage protein (TIGR01671 family)